MKKLIILFLFFVTSINIGFADLYSTGVINENKEKGITYIKSNYNSFIVQYNKNNTYYSFLGIKNMKKMDSIVTVIFIILTFYILLKFLNKQS